MSRVAEQALFGLLIEESEMRVLAMEGFPLAAIPTAELRPVLDWALRYYNQGGQRTPPTVEALGATVMPDAHDNRTMLEVLAEHGITYDELPGEHMAWAIEELKSTHITYQFNEWGKQAAQDIASAPSSKRPEILAEYASDLVGLSLNLEGRRTRVDMRESGSEILQAYEAAKLNQLQFMGMSFALPEIDQHTFGVWPGELAILAAYAKVGKSYFVDRVALREFEQGRSVALFTLENSIEMTQNRIACLAAGVDPTRWEQGQALPDEEGRVKDWVHNVLEARDSPLHIMRPGPGESTAEQIVTKARLLRVDSLIVDQLTFVTPTDPSMQRYLQIRQMMHDFKELISTGEPIPCLLAHQVSREGNKRARVANKHIMEDLAEGSEAERTADWVFSLYQSDDMFRAHRVLFQILAGRRRAIRAWQLLWRIDAGNIAVDSEVFV